VAEDSEIEGLSFAFSWGVNNNLSNSLKTGLFVREPDFDSTSHSRNEIVNYGEKCAKDGQDKQVENSNHGGEANRLPEGQHGIDVESAPSDNRPENGVCGSKNSGLYDNDMKNCRRDDDNYRLDDSHKK
jgi:hypothetical protein